MKKRKKTIFRSLRHTTMKNWAKRRRKHMMIT